MNGFAKFLNTNPKTYPPKKKAFVFCLIMLPSISIFAWFAVQTYIRGSENFEDLTHVTGIITNERIMKHKHNGKHKSYDEDVIVISIQGCDDELGFMAYDACYPKLTNLVSKNREIIADVYYDQHGQRIEQNVTLHTFDLKINGERIVRIEDIRKSELTGSLICSLITVLLILFTFIGAKKIKLKGVIG